MIPKVCLSHSVGPFHVHSPLMRCPRCIYGEMVRRMTTLKCPFIQPYPRMTKNGALPKVIQSAIDDAINKAKQEHGHDE